MEQEAQTAKKKKKVREVHDVIMWFHKWNTDQVLNPQSFRMLQDYFNTYQIPYYQTEDWLKKFAPMWAGMWGYYLYKKFNPAKGANTIVANGKTYQTTKLKIHKELKTFFNDELKKPNGATRESQSIFSGV